MYKSIYLILYINSLWYLSKGAIKVAKDDSLTSYHHAFDGNVTDIVEYPFMASLQKKVPLMTIIVQFTYIHKCSGTILSSKWFLTSGVCVWDFSDKMIIDLTEHAIVAGSTNCTVYGNEDIQKYNIEKVFLHPDYDYINQLNDVALILIKNNFTFTNYIYRVELSNQETDIRKTSTVQHCMTIGWTAKSILIYSNKTLVSIRSCAQLFPDNAYAKKFICTYDNVINCCGDSGSPLICNGVQTGISSQGCFGTGLAVWTQIGEYQNWLESITSKFTNTGYHHSNISLYNFLIILILTYV